MLFTAQNLAVQFTVVSAMSVAQPGRRHQLPLLSRLGVTGKKSVWNGTEDHLQRGWHPEPHLPVSRTLQPLLSSVHCLSRAESLYNVGQCQNQETDTGTIPLARLPPLFSFHSFTRMHLCVCMCCFSCWVVSESSVTPWNTACQAPLSVGSPRQEYWSELPFPSPGDLPDPRVELTSLALQVDSLPLSHQGSPVCSSMQ